MRHCWTGAAVGLGVVLISCGVPEGRYRAQVARADRLESHLKKKLDRIDYLEAKDRTAEQRARQARQGDIRRMAKLNQALAQMQATLVRLRQAHHVCRTRQTRPAKLPTVQATAQDPSCRLPGFTLALEPGLILCSRRAPPAGLKAQVRRALKQTLTEAASCALKVALRKRRSPQGRLVLTLRFDRKGRARRVWVAHDDVSLARAGRCVRKSLARLRLPDLGAPLFLAVPLRFGALPPGRARCRKSPPQRSYAQRAARAIHTHEAAINLCFISSGLRHKKLRKVRIEVSLTVGGRGTVTRAQVVSSVLKRASLNQCVLKAVQRFKLPRPRQGAQTLRHVFRWAAKARPRRKRRRRRRRRRR